MQPYSARFFDQLQAGALRSARAVVPFLLQLLRPHSVIDMGCGRGAWLAVFREQGVEDVLGVDGAAIAPEQMAVPPTCFFTHNLETPLRLGRQFDLALSLEVAEHLPATAAEPLVESLVGLAPLVLFSAAVPGQGGTHHVNEQWPEYWAQRFMARGYHPIDCLRRRFWANPQVEWWYSQNMILYGRLECLAAVPALKQDFAQTDPRCLALVHPGCLLNLLAQTRELAQRLRTLHGSGSLAQGQAARGGLP